jgi:hypothetical protein
MQAAKTSKFYTETFSRVQRNFGICLADLLIYDIFFKIIAVAILGPLAAWIFNRLVATSGALVIGNEHMNTSSLSFFHRLDRWPSFCQAGWPWLSFLPNKPA